MIIKVEDHYGVNHSTEISDDANLYEAVAQFCRLCVAVGYAEKNVQELREQVLGEAE